MEKIGQRKIGIIILGIMVVISLVLMALLWDKKTGDVCLISINGKKLKEISLDIDYTEQIKTEAGYNTIQIRNGIVSVIEADCNNQICVLSDSISKNGQVISCLPHGLVITIQSKAKEVDAVAY